MRIAAVVIQNAVRVVGLIAIIVGILFWTGHALNLLPLHMRLGETLSGLLMVLAILAFVARLKPVLPVIAIVWALLVVFFGMRMGQMLPGPAHQVIRVLHLFIGLIAIALSESLAARIRRKLALI